MTLQMRSQLTTLQMRSQLTSRVRIDLTCGNDTIFPISTSSQQSEILQYNSRQAEYRSQQLRHMGSVLVVSQQAVTFFQTMKMSWCFPHQLTR